MNSANKSTGLSELEELCVQTIRFLSIDGVQKAGSGHPGMPMGMAPAAYVLWTRHMKYDPADPKWHNRDRFVLSAGHGSMLLYSMLYLTGFDYDIKDLKNFRQWRSKTPGHPEYDPDRGIEVTTGPLGQGIGNAVGMAIAEKYLAEHFNRNGCRIVDYRIYVIAGDGCLQEGVASEACSLAGHLKLDNLIVIYDDNRITIDGGTNLSFTENRTDRFKSYGWNVEVVGGDGNDMAAFDAAVKRAKAAAGRPTLIQLRTHIAYGSPNKQDTAEAHGSPLGDEEIRLIKKKYGWDENNSFYVPEKVLDHMRAAGRKAAEAHDEWKRRFEEYQRLQPDLARNFAEAAAGKMSLEPSGGVKFEPGASIATRKASGMVLDSLMPRLPLVIGGSADLTPSNNTRFKGAEDFQPNAYGGRYIRYGVREHAMGAIMNGISVSGLLRPYGGTFLVFSDYMRASIRVAALSKYPVIYVFTHDSVGLGEDGPTHQPVEHLAALRAIPNMVVIRPADADETAAAWSFILQHKEGPVALILSRQGLPVINRTGCSSSADLARGAYTLARGEKFDVILMGTGSEVSTVVEASNKLATEGIRASVVSMPSWELFERQEKRYRDSVLPPAVKARVAAEAGVEHGWRKWLGDRGRFVGMRSFGASAPGKTCFEKFGITADAVVKAARESLEG